MRRCLVSKPSPARQGGETIRLSPTFHRHQLPQTQSPMSHPGTGHPCSVAGTQQLDVLPKPRLTAAQVGRMVGTTDHAPPQALSQQTPERQGSVPVPTAQDSSSPCLHPVERKNSLARGKYKALCRVGPAAGFLKARKQGPILHWKVTFRRTLRMLICLARPLCPPLLSTATEVICGCASRTNGRRMLGLYLQFSDQNFKPWPGCHCCQHPLSRDKDLL